LRAAKEEEAAVRVTEELSLCPPHGTIPYGHLAVPEAWGLLPSLQDAAKFLHPA